MMFLHQPITPSFTRWRARLCPLLLAQAVLIGGCGGGADDGQLLQAGSGPRAIPVVAAEVTFEAESNRIEAIGTSQALKSIELHPEVAGQVVEVAFAGGEVVTAGDVLVSLDARDQTLAVELAEVHLADARLLFQRYENASGVEAVPPTTLDSARTALEAARIELDRARVALDDRFVRAPFTGAVGITDVEPGDRIDPTTVIASLDDRSALLISFDVPEAFVGKVREGDLIRVETWTADRLGAVGPVVTVGSRIDPATRSFTLRARVPNDDDRLRPGMSFRVLLDLNGAVWPVVPEVSLQWGASGPYVWAVREGRAERVPARVIQRRQGRVLIEAALAAGDQVVAEGVQRMREGIPVRLLDADALAEDALAVLAAEAAR
ncbi:MAG: efflux RND transporter periplasmic adaptor subunit [Pseudomonadales bacterium]